MQSEGISEECLRGCNPSEGAQALWQELMDGRRVVVSALQTENRMHLRLAQAKDGPARALTDRERQVLVFAARGETSKVMALELGLAESTISARIASAAKKVGLSSRQLLMLVAVGGLRQGQGRLGSAAPPGLRRDDAPASGRPHLSFTWPLTVPTQGLTPAERAVAGMLLEGRSSSEIAHLRGTSVNTVGNQIAALYQKFQVTNRIDLARSLCAVDESSTANGEGFQLLRDVANAS